MGLQLFTSRKVRRGKGQTSPESLGNSLLTRISLKGRKEGSYNGEALGDSELGHLKTRDQRLERLACYGSEQAFIDEEGGS